MSSVGRQVVDREWQRGAFPDAAVQPGPDIVVKPSFPWGGGMKRDLAQLQVDPATRQRQGVE